tara:strand:+ start:461 stop:1369 length:909 start_codon:yes stop_codon:yes gene_type:complete
MERPRSPSWDYVPGSAALEESDGLCRCTFQKKRNGKVAWHCKNVFPSELNAHGVLYKHCPHHRAQTKRANSTTAAKENRKKYANSEKGKSVMSRYLQTDKAKAKHHRNNHSEKAVDRRARYWKSDKGKANSKRNQSNDKGKATRQRYAQSDKGKAASKRQNSKCMHKLSASFLQMVKKTHRGPVTFPMLGTFISNQDACSHLESTFEPWMNHENQGMYRAGDAYKSKWNIGHRLPKSIYDEHLGEDLRRCWHRSNIFAQCARHNVEVKDRLIMTDAQLLELKALWPAKAKGCLEALKLLFSG